MFGFSRAGKMGKVDTMIGPGAEMRGSLSDKGTIYVDGKVDGNIQTEDGIVVGQHGQIKGNLNSRSVVVSGKVTGDVHALDHVELLATAVVKGDIRSARLSVEDGAWFEGTCEMETKEQGAEIKAFKKANPS